MSRTAAAEAAAGRTSVVSSACLVPIQHITCGYCSRNLARIMGLLYYRLKKKNHEAPLRISLSLRNFRAEVPYMNANCAAQEGYEISPRFRRTIEDRIARLERDAEHDEAQVAELKDNDHVRRHMRLVAVQRSEALRMRLFLDRARTRLPRPLIEL